MVGSRANNPTTPQPSATALFYRNIRYLRFVDRFGRKGQGILEYQ